MKLASVLRRKDKDEQEFPTSMLAELNEFLVSPAFEKEFNNRKQGCFHPSELRKTCRRRLAYEFLSAPVNPTFRDPRLQMIFEAGHGIHHRLQKLAHAFSKRRGLEFEDEVKILPSENPHLIGGSCDGVWWKRLFKRRQPEIGLEIKTINKNGFTGLSKPQQDHIFQGNIYMGALKMPRIAFWYFCKDNSAMKEFIIPFSKPLFKQATDVIDGIMGLLRAGKLPNKVYPGCNDPACKFNRICQTNKTVKELANEDTRKQILAYGRR